MCFLQPCMSKTDWGWKKALVCSVVRSVDVDTVSRVGFLSQTTQDICVRPRIGLHVTCSRNHGCHSLTCNYIACRVELCDIVLFFFFMLTWFFFVCVCVYSQEANFSQMATLEMWRGGKSIQDRWSVEGYETHTFFCRQRDVLLVNCASVIISG